MKIQLPQNFDEEFSTSVTFPIHCHLHLAFITENFESLLFPEYKRTNVSYNAPTVIYSYLAAFSDYTANKYRRQDYFILRLLL